MQAFLKCVCCCNFTENYGLTENAGKATGAFASDMVTGHIGGPMACMKLRLRAIPEMGYECEDLESGTNPKGEVCMKGPSVFKGYYNNQ